MNENRALVSVKRIDAIEPLRVKSGEPARSELVRIGGWRATASVGEFQVGQLVVFAEPDSVFPVEERWSFLERKHYRIETQKYNNILTQAGEPTISQGLVLPMDVLPKGTYEEGQDVTKLLGVTHAPEPDDVDEFEANAEFSTSNKRPAKFKWLPKGIFNRLMRHEWFRKLALPKKEPKGFVQEVSKTDEERIQNCGKIVNADTTWTLTEKVDGQSGTYRLRKVKGGFLKRLFGKPQYDFAVCSRNNRLNKPDNSSHWAMAKKYNIEEVLKKLLNTPMFKGFDWIAIQGEVAGPKIQKNRQGLTENHLYVFNLITPKGRVKSMEARVYVGNLGLEWVPIISYGVDLHGKTEQDLLEMANGMSLLNPERMREGIVFRAENPDLDLSFKAVSPEYELKNK